MVRRQVPREPQPDCERLQISGTVTIHLYQLTWTAEWHDVSVSSPLYRYQQKVTGNTVTVRVETRKLKTKWPIVQELAVRKKFYICDCKFLLTSNVFREEICFEIKLN